jgi:uncharacterized membrane protein
MRFHRGAAPVASRRAANGANPGEAQPGHIADTVAEVVEVESRARVGMTFSDHVADYITRVAGSMAFVWIHVVWFSAWIILNVGLWGLGFDPYPFSFLTMVVSLEAIFLSTFVLISQNRQALHADRRAKLDLQVNMIAEREVTKLMELVNDIHEAVSGGSRDRAADEMRQETSVSDLIDAVDSAEEDAPSGTDDPPSSAADTET